jgi:hypothetical protein
MMCSFCLRTARGADHIAKVSRSGNGRLRVALYDWRLVVARIKEKLRRHSREMGNLKDRVDLWELGGRLQHNDECTG